MHNWKRFVHGLVNQDVSIEYKRVQLAQACVESGRGTSELFVEYGNPYGMKFRREMSAFAIPVYYKNDKYCAFENESDAVEGYWVFLNRKVYDGWQKTTDSHSFLRHLIECGYVGGDDENRKDYFDKVTRFFNEVNHIFRLV